MLLCHVEITALSSKSNLTHQDDSIGRPRIHKWPEIKAQIKWRVPPHSLSVLVTILCFERVHEMAVKRRRSRKARRQQSLAVEKSILVRILMCQI